jgi:hypothetical protein
MKMRVLNITFVALLLSSTTVYAQYVCMGTFIKKTDEYEKGFRTTVYDYYYRNGVLQYGVPKTGYVDAKLIRLDKDCVLERLERRLDLETVR